MMAKVSLTLPASLLERVQAAKKTGDRFNMSALLRKALEEELDRRDQEEVDFRLLFQKVKGTLSEKEWGVYVDLLPHEIRCRLEKMAREKWED